MDVGARKGSQVFRASWRSSLIWLAVFLALMGAGAGAMALNTPRGGWLAGLLALFFVGMAWLLLRPFFSAHPILHVGAEGIGGFLLKGQTIPWTDIADIEHLAVQGQDHIQIRLREGAMSAAATRSWMHRGLKRGIVLSPLRRADRQPAIQAVLQAFQRHASGQARAAWGDRLDELQAHDAFEARLVELTPVPWALYTVMGLNALVWLLNLFDGMSAMKPTPAELFAWGANSSTAVVRDGDYWRLLTATFLHGGVLHLVLNMFALWDAGRRVCRWFGNGQFLLIYLGAGLTGSALSLHFSSQQAVSVGASGAVFGVLGALLVGVLQHRERVPKGMVQQLLTTQGVFVVIMLVQGFARPGIDNAAHIGGLVAGAVLAWLLIELVDEQAGVAQRRVRQVLALLAVAVMAGGLTAMARPGVDHPQLFAAQSALARVLPDLQAAEKALQADLAARREGRLSEAALVDAMEQRHIPAYRVVDQAFKRIKPPPVADSMLADVAEFHAAMLEVMTLEVGKFRGAQAVAPADARMAVLADRIKTLGERLRSRRSAAPS